MVSVLGLVLVDTSLAAESIGSAPSTNTDTGEEKNYTVNKFSLELFSRFFPTLNFLFDIYIPLDFYI